MENDELKCTITITGKTGDTDAQISVKFDPSIKGDAHEWDSGAGDLVMQVLEVLKRNRV